MIFPNASPKQTAYLLNLNNQLNEKDKNFLTLNVMDFDINKPQGGGEIKTKQTYPFKVGEQIFIKIDEKKGYAKYYKIYRFKPLLFKVDLVEFKVEEKDIVEYYEEKKKGADLLGTEAIAQTFKIDKESIYYTSEVCNVSEILQILFNRWENKITEERYEKVLFSLLVSLYIHPSFLSFSKVDEWYKLLRFH